MVWKQAPTPQTARPIPTRATPPPLCQAGPWSGKTSSTRLACPTAANGVMTPTTTNVVGGAGSCSTTARKRLENYRVVDGKLLITARQERLTNATDYGNQNFSSARLVTRGKASWTCGCFEMRSKLPCTMALGPPSGCWAPEAHGPPTVRSRSWNKRFFRSQTNSKCWAPCTQRLTTRRRQYRTNHPLAHNLHRLQHLPNDQGRGQGGRVCERRVLLHLQQPTQSQLSPMAL